MKPILTHLSLFCACISFGQQASISGIIHHADSPVIYLESMTISDGNPVVRKLDSCVFKSDGKFNLKLNLKQPQSVFLFDGSDVLNLVLIPGDQLFVETDKRFFDETLVLTGTGADRNMALHQLEIIKEGIHKKVIQSRFNPDTLQIFTEYDQELSAYQEIQSSCRKRFPELQSYLDEAGNQLEAEKNMHIDFIRMNHLVNTRITGLTNQQAPELSGFNLKGDPVKLSDFKGKITVVDFWATWCGPCRAEFPKLEEFQKLYGKDIHFVSIATFCRPEEWREVVKDSKLPNQMFIEESNQKQLDAYALAYVPRYIVLDANHQIISADAPLPSSGVLQKYWVK